MIPKEIGTEDGYGLTEIYVDPFTETEEVPQYKLGLYWEAFKMTHRN